MKNNAQKYLESQILTAPREQLLVILLDGAVRFALQGKEKFQEKLPEEGTALLIRAQRIVLELVGSLPREALGEAMFANLAGLYMFAYQRLLQGSVRKDGALVDEAVSILSHLRETWMMSLEKDLKEKTSPPALAAKAPSREGPLNVEG